MWNPAVLNQNAKYFDRPSLPTQGDNAGKWESKKKK
jgi:hypothetical protein